MTRLCADEALDSEAWFAFMMLGDARHETRIFLNGIEVQEVVLCDDRTGELLMLARDEWGEPVLDGPRWAPESKWCLILTRGHVRIETGRPV